MGEPFGFSPARKMTFKIARLPRPPGMNRRALRSNPRPADCESYSGKFRKGLILGLVSPFTFKINPLRPFQ
jgi:hypothetical protein